MESHDPLVDSSLPAVDDLIVPPDSRLELIDGVLVYVPPADEDHAELHVKLSSLVVAHTAPSHRAACDMLTRTDHKNELAPDVSVFARERNPATGGRFLEELAFEIVATGSWAPIRDKAIKLRKRGVRRVFAIDVRKDRVLEWSVAQGTWIELDRNGHIEDPVFVAPLPVAELLTFDAPDDTVAGVLIAKRNPTIEAFGAQCRDEGEEEGQLRGREEGLRKGRIEGLIEGRLRGQVEGRLRGQIEGRVQGQTRGIVRTKAGAIVAVLDARGIPLEADDRTRILDETDPERLDRWLAIAATCTTARTIFDAG